MKLLIFFTLTSLSAYAAIKNKDKVYITIDRDALSSMQKILSGTKELKTNSVSSTILEVDQNDLEKISKHMHENFNRCSGYILHESVDEAHSFAQVLPVDKSHKNLFSYSITETERVRDMISKTSEINIREMIIDLSKFKNRYYKSPSGVESQSYIKKSWEKLSAHRNDTNVKYFKHQKWPQPSVILTIEGSTKKNEIIVIGGHADSIAGWWRQSKNRAPGADDNASGIATMTEVIRVAMESGYRPERTVKFMAYAAEEVGLRGSKEIAAQFKAQKKDVIGVVQLDMTNHKGTKDLDIVFMTDYTNREQTRFMGKLIDEYVKVPWGYSKCGYGCSDHASWHAQGFAASMPFESTMEDINSHIHTSRDTIEKSKGDATHAHKFAKLALAYMIETGK